jgi:Cu(I)/Ag(I) efflux system membrane fusion protein
VFLADHTTFHAERPVKTLAIILLTLGIAVPGTWLISRQMSKHAAPTGASAPAGRSPLFFQSAMHPWIKSDKPGRCTICGMELTPVYPGEQGLESADENIITLSQSMQQVLGVQTEEVARRPLGKTLRVAGTIDDNQTRHRVLSAYVAGRIEKLEVNYVGAEVTAGQPLAHLYSPALLVARDEYLALARKPAGQERLLAATREKLLRLGLTAEQVAKLPEQKNAPPSIEILAPMTGTVVAQNVYEGQYVQEGERLFEIADFSIMWFVFQAYETDLPLLQIGQEVEVTTPSHPGQVFTGTISFIEPNFDEATRATKVRVEIPNRPPGDPHRLLHRLYADGLVRLDAPDVLAVPRTAVIQTGAEAGVVVDHGGGAYGRHTVKLGRRGDGFVEVLEGVEEGDRVVTQGNLLIDSQAEMNRAFTATPEPASPATASHLTDAQRRAVEDFTRTADAVAAALAADDLAGFQKSAPDATAATEKLVAALRERADLAAPLQQLAGARLPQDAPDLAAARKAFHPFSMAAAALLQPMRRDASAPEFAVWECPMVDEAIPGVPKRGRWIQVANRGIANPFFGAEMLECGMAVKP